jgi:hypothetical protein
MVALDEHGKTLDEPIGIKKIDHSTFAAKAGTNERARFTKLDVLVDIE